MARPRRIELKDGCYHVINRGLERRRSVRAAADFERFLRPLGGLPSRFGVLVPAYARMPNHSHLLIHGSAGAPPPRVRLVARRFGRYSPAEQEVRRGVLEFEASGLRQSEFCRRHGLALSTLKRHLKKRGLSRGKARAAVELAGQDRKRELRAGAALEVVLACGRRIEVRPAFDAATLGRLVEVLEAL